jgi:hypothetical protein
MLARSVRRDNLPKVSVRTPDGALMSLSPANIRAATLSPAGHAFEWQLNVPNTEVAYAGAVARSIGATQQVLGQRMAYLRDDAAKRVLANILPHVNALGGNRRELRDALGVLDDAPSVHYMLHRASVTQSPWWQPNASSTEIETRGPFGAMRARMRAELRRATPVRLRSSPVNEIALGHLPSSLRLALEMSLHEDDERRAMQGELKELESRWKDAEEIARISDEMFVRPEISQQLNELRAESVKKNSGTSPTSPHQS